jgi:hypothetical protein
LTQSLEFFLFLNYDAKHTLYVPRGETVTAAYIHKVVCGFKRPSMSVQNFSPGCQPSCHRCRYFQQLAVEKGIMKFSQLTYYRLSHHQPFISSSNSNWSWQAAC